jgi:hypothetical protein
MRCLDLIGVVFQSLYSTEIIPLLPQLIAEVAEGNYQNLSTLLSSFLADNEFFSIGMQYSVQCHEEISFSQPGEEAVDLVTYPQLEQFFAGSSELDAAVCAEWGAGMADAIENEPIRSDIPTLVLAGQYDPITPPAWGLTVATALSDHYYFEFPGVGHGASVSGECPLSITLAFLNEPAQEPNAACIAAMEGPEFAASGTASGTITLVPFAADLGVAQVEGVVPQGWEEAAPGIYGRMNTALDQTFILQQAVPGMRGEQFLALLASQLGLDESPTSTGVYEAENHTWTLYETALQGLPADIALAEDGDYTYVVLLVTPAEERNALYTAVFLPVLEALRVN